MTRTLTGHTPEGRSLRFTTFKGRFTTFDSAQRAESIVHPPTDGASTKADILYAVSRLNTGLKSEPLNLNS